VDDHQKFAVKKKSTVKVKKSMVYTIATEGRTIRGMKGGSPWNEVREIDCIEGS
jgi:hypothetical protein